MHALARVATDYILEVVDMAVDLGADIIALDGDLAFSQTTLMSPAQYDEFILPYHQGDNGARARARGKLIFKHSDGNMCADNGRHRGGRVSTASTPSSPSAWTSAR